MVRLGVRAPTCPPRCATALEGRGAAARVGASKHLDRLQQRIDALLGYRGKTN